MAHETSGSQVPIGQAGSMRTISDTKLVSFAVGQQKKSRFQKAKEEREAKKKEEEKEAAIVYDSFVKSFADEAKSKAFVRAGGLSDNVPVPSNRVSNDLKGVSGRWDDRDQISNLQSKPPSSSAKHRAIDDLLSEFKTKQSDTSDCQDATLMSQGSYPSGDTNTTNIFISFLSPIVTEEQLFDAFSKYGPINSIKVMWPRSEEERQRKKNTGFVSYMNRADAEDALMFLQGVELGGQPLNMGWGKSVRINPTPVNRLAVVAKTSLSSETVLPSIPRVTHVQSKWDKVPPAVDSGYYPGAPTVTIIPPSDSRTKRAIDLLAKHVAADGNDFESIVRQKEAGNPLFTFLSDSESQDAWYYRWKTFSILMGDSGSSWRGEPFQMVTGGPFVVPPPPPPPNDSNNNEAFSGNSTDRYRKRPRSHSPGNSRHEKLKYAGMTGAQIERQRELERRGGGAVGTLGAQEQEYRALVRGGAELLSDAALEEWEKLLDELTLSGVAVKRAMGFAFDYIASCEEVVAVLKNAVNDSRVAPPRRVALLFLISDILHNSGAAIKQASNYRILLQFCLPEIFESLGDMLRATGGRMTARQIESRVRSVLQVWSDWSIFPPLFITGLELLFLITEAEQSKLRSLVDGEVVSDALRKRSRACAVPLWRNGEALSAAEISGRVEYVENYAKAILGNQLSSAPSAEITDSAKTTCEVETLDHDKVPHVSESEDVDGVPLDDDVDGIPMEDAIDGIPMDNDDIDGAPLDDDLDGAPMDDDIDGVPLE